MFKVYVFVGNAHFFDPRRVVGPGAINVICKEASEREAAIYACGTHRCCAITRDGEIELIKAGGEYISLEAWDKVRP